MSDAPAPPAGASGSSATTAIAAATADPSKAGAAAGAQTPAAGANSKEVDSLTTIGSMEELKKKAPEVYNMMMQGLATNIVNEMRRRDERLKKMWRENRSRAGIVT